MERVSPADDHPGRRSDRSADPDQHPAGRRTPSRSSSAPASCPSSWTRPTRWPGPTQQAPPVGAGPRWPVAGAGRVRVSVTSHPHATTAGCARSRRPEGPNIGLIETRCRPTARVNPFRVQSRRPTARSHGAGHPTQIDYPHRGRGGPARHSAGRRCRSARHGAFAEDHVLVARKGSGSSSSAGRGRLHGRLTAPDGLGRTAHDPVPGARRRQPCA